ncbi:MAG: LysM peptidoglycan-binding domain-containing protein, partial [Ilumatobacteraceae bacterium]
MLALFVGFSVLLPTSPASATACKQFHTAKPNDSWTRISARFGVSLRELLTLNQATTETSIFIGDKLCISTQQVVQRPTATYTRKQVRAIIREVWPDELEET